jgi:hypothetical protein
MAGMRILAGADPDFLGGAADGEAVGVGLEVYVGRGVGLAVGVGGGVGLAVAVGEGAGISSGRDLLTGAG